MTKKPEALFPYNGSAEALEDWQHKAHIGYGRQVRVASTVLGSEGLSEVKGWFHEFSGGELSMSVPWAVFDPEGHMTRFEMIEDFRISVPRIRAIHGTTGLGVLVAEAKILKAREAKLADKK